MKSPILILFIIFNLLAVNLVSAMDFHDEEADESHFVQIHDDAVPANNADDPDCDHCCHISAHLSGFVTYAAELSTVNTSIVSIIQKDQLSFLNLEPPSHPPQA